MECNSVYIEGEKLANDRAGLAIAKRIVELHGGRIWVESARGARFDVLGEPADQSSE